MPERLVVLGGGIGALSTVFALTQQPGWQARFSITVYQPGWRLGGKAWHQASRSPSGWRAPLDR